MSVAAECVAEKTATNRIIYIYIYIYRMYSFQVTSFLYDSLTGRGWDRCFRRWFYAGKRQRSKRSVAEQSWIARSRRFRIQNIIIIIIIINIPSGWPAELVIYYGPSVNKNGLPRRRLIRVVSSILFRFLILTVFYFCSREIILRFVVVAVLFFR